MLFNILLMYRVGAVDKYWGTETKTKKTIFRLSESANIKIPKCIMLGMDAIIGELIQPRNHVVIRGFSP